MQPEDKSTEDTRWARKARANSTAKAVVGGAVGVHAYRAQFNERGKSVLADRANYDFRRVMSWAPYVVLPGIAIASKAVPAEHRPRFWVATLVFYGCVSVGMYNSSAADED